MRLVLGFLVLVLGSKSLGILRLSALSTQSMAWEMAFKSKDFFGALSLSVDKFTAHSTPRFWSLEQNGDPVLIGGGGGVAGWLRHTHSDCAIGPGWLER